jgi:excisionase family DNA binding protein
MKPSRSEEVSLLSPLHTIAEAAKILRCSERTIRRLIWSGRLRAVQVGRCYRIRRHDLSELLRASLTTPPAEQDEEQT